MGSLIKKQGDNATTSSSIKYYYESTKKGKLISEVLLINFPSHSDSCLM